MTIDEGEEGNATLSKPAEVEVNSVYLVVLLYNIYLRSNKANGGSMHVLWQSLVRNGNSRREHWAQEEADNHQTSSIRTDRSCLPDQDNHCTCYETVQGDHTLFTKHPGDMSQYYSTDRQTRL